MVAKKDGSNEPVNHKAFWWEVLCLLKGLPLPHVETVVALFGTPALKVGGCTRLGRIVACKIIVVAS